MSKNLRSSLNTGLNNGLRQSISGGVNGLGFFKTANLDLQFASRKTLDDRVSGSNLITFTRASSATYVGSDGLIKTAVTDTPRFDHDPAAGESLGLFIEEARTNLVTYSDLSSATNEVNIANTASTEVNPQGVASCRRLLSDAGGNTGEGQGHRLKNIGGTTSSANDMTVSVFVKKDTHRYVYLTWGGPNNSFTALFDIEPSLSGDRLLDQAGAGTYTNIAAGYENYANDWVRIWASGTTTGSGGFNIGLAPDDSTAIITDWVAAGTEAIFVHGAQYEDNATFPSSYIPTSGATATRAADVVSIGGADFSSFYNQTEGTIFTDHRIQGTESSNGRVWKLTTANRLYYRSTGVLETNTATQYLSFPGTVGVDTFTKTAIAIKENDHAGYNSDDGVLRTANSGTTAAASLLCIGCTQSGYQLNGHIKRLAYFNTRLPDATLQSITS